MATYEKNKKMPSQLEKLTQNILVIGWVSFIAYHLIKRSLENRQEEKERKEEPTRKYASIEERIGLIFGALIGS